MTKIIGDLRSGVEEKLVSATTGSTPGMPNYGVTFVSTYGGTTGGNYVLGAPEEGVHKYITASLTTQSTAVTITVSAGTTNDVKIGQASTGLLWTASSAAGVAGSAHLVGINSTLWGVVSLHLTTLA